jgi:hypothetical protein
VFLAAPVHPIIGSPPIRLPPWRRGPLTQLGLPADDVSDFGSEMGAADRVQVRSGAVIVSLGRPLNCTDVSQQAGCPLMRAVRIEGVRGSNPLSSTQHRRSEP